MVKKEGNKRTGDEKRRENQMNEKSVKDERRQGTKEERAIRLPTDTEVKSKTW